MTKRNHPAIIDARDVLKVGEIYDHETKTAMGKLLRLVQVARKIKAARDERLKRARDMQELAKEARRTGKSLTHRIDNTTRLGPWGSC